MSGAYDWIGNLQEITWGALTAPCIETSFDGGHDQAERKYPYVDGAAHDNTGRTPYSIRATLVFNNTIASDLLPARLEKWLDALENGKIDGLSHPVLGNMFARVMTWSAPRRQFLRGCLQPVAAPPWARSWVVCHHFLSRHRSTVLVGPYGDLAR